MKKTRVVLASIGAVLIVVGVLVRVVGDPTLIRFPSNLNQSYQYAGTMTSYVNPATFSPLATPVAGPLTINRQVKVVSSSYSQVVIDETIHITSAGTTRTETYRYVMDRRSMQLVNSSKSYAFGDPAALLHGAGDYRINLPLGFSASKSFPGFAPQTDSATPLQPTGSPHHDSTAGVQVQSFNSSVNAPVASYYVTYLGSQGLPATISSQAVASLLQAQHIDINGAITALLPLLTPAQLATVTTLLARPVPVNYTYFYAGQISAQPTTGAIVSSSASSEGVAARLDLSGASALLPILAQHTDLAPVRALIAGLTAVSTAPPQPILRMQYAETPASVHQEGSYVQSQSNKIDLIRLRIPVTLIVIGAVLLLAGALWPRRRRQPAPTEPAAPTPTGVGAPNGEAAGTTPGAPNGEAGGAPAVSPPVPSATPGGGTGPEPPG